MIDKLIAPVTGLLDKFIPDADEKAKLAHEIATMSQRHAQDLALAQIQVNAAEAASGSTFKGGWRPFIGWICGLAFGWHFIGQPVALFVVAMTGTEIPPLPEAPPLVSTIMENQVDAFANQQIAKADH